MDERLAEALMEDFDLELMEEGIFPKDLYGEVDGQDSQRRSPPRDADFFNSFEDDFDDDDIA